MLPPKRDQTTQRNEYIKETTGSVNHLKPKASLQSKSVSLNKKDKIITMAKKPKGGDPTPHEHVEHSHIHEAPDSHVDYVKSTLESMDFIYPVSAINLHKGTLGGMPKSRLERTEALILAALTGMCTAGVGAFILTSFESFCERKFKFLSILYQNYFLGHKAFTFWCFYGLVLSPAMFGGILAIFVEPKAAGGGIAGVIGYFNGVKVPGLLTLKVIIVKAASVLGCCCAVLAAGMEGPMVHIGAAIGWSLPRAHIPFTKIQPFRDSHRDEKRRDLVGTGISCGIVAAFSTPLGGVVLAFEEGLTYWDSTLFIRIMVGAVFAAFFLNFLLTLFTPCPGCLDQTILLFFFVLQEKYVVHEIDKFIREFPLYILTGIIAGLSGALWNYIQIKLISLRAKYVKKPFEQFIELFVIASLTAISNYTFFYVFSNKCIPHPHLGEGFHEPHHLISLGCTKHHEFASPATFLLQTGPNVIRSMYDETYDHFGVPVLFSYTVIYFLLSVITMGAMIGAGIFVPNLVLGAVWGRLLGEIFKKTSFYETINPAKFAYLAAGCQLCGVTRVPFSLAVIMTEAAGDMILGYAIFISLIATSIIGNLFNVSIYHHQCYMAGIPILFSKPPPNCTHLKAENLMKSPPVTFNQETTVGRILETLNKTPHNAFPIVDGGGRLEGLITRQQIILLLKRYIHIVDPDPDEYLEITKNDFPSMQTLKQLNELGLSPQETVKFGWYMDPTPISVQKQCPFEYIYKLLACTGLRHVLVVDSSNKIVGVITRKDVAIYRFHPNLYHAGVTKLKIK